MVGPRGEYGAAPEKRFINPVTHNVPETMPGLEGRAGARPKVEGENVYAQMTARLHYLEQQLAARAGAEVDVQSLKSLMTAGETDNFPRMNKEQIRDLAAVLVARKGLDVVEEEPGAAAAK